MKKFEGLDFLNLDQYFSSEEKMARDSVREFVSSEIIPIMSEHYENGTFPVHLIQPLAELGTLGSTLQGYGCAGVNSTTYGLLMQEIERGDSGIRSFVSVQGALCMYPIYTYGTEEQKNKYLEKMAQGKLIGCFGLTEPDFGSNPSGMRCSVKKVGSNYILNGSKMWITNGGISHLAIVWAKNEEGKVCGFIVDRDTPGFKVKNIEKKFSLRASVTSELIFEDCKLPLNSKLQVEGMKGPLSCLNQARFGISWGVLGAAMACFDEARNYVLTRKQFDRPLAAHQLIQSKLVEIYTEITKGQLLAYHVGRLKDQNQVKPEQISMAKMNNVSMALRAARLCRDMMGANGITYEYQCARHLLNLESVNTYEGTEDIHRLILGQHLTGLGAFQ